MNTQAYHSLRSRAVAELKANFDRGSTSILADIVIDIGRESKNVGEFAFSLKLDYNVPRHSWMNSLLDAIHQLFPPESNNSVSQREESRIKIEVIEEDPEFIRQQRERFPDSRDEEAKNQDSWLNRAVKANRAYIEKHRSELEDSLARQALEVVQTLPERKESISKVGPVLQESDKFPASEFKNQIIQALRLTQAIIIVGRAGFGKTTQIPQYLAEEGYASNGLVIGCSHPRSKAAEFAARDGFASDWVSSGSTAERVPKRAIEYMDDFSLCREIIADKLLSKYSVVMIDDAQERSITADVLFGLIRDVMKNRADLKVVVALANWDEAKRLERYIFSHTIVGQSHHDHGLMVEIKSFPEPSSKPLEEALEYAMERRIENVVLFVSGQEEADFAAWFLADQVKNLNSVLPNVVILQACSSVRSEIDPRVFEKPSFGTVHWVVATPAFEVHIDAVQGVPHVIDLGLTERRVIDVRQAVDAVEITLISRASVLRRVRPSRHKYFRVYTDAMFRDQMSSVAEPEILTANLGTAVLQISCSATNDISNFEFVDRPQSQHVASALRQLYCLEALDETGDVTELGKLMALFPLDPPWSRALVAGLHFKCIDEVLTVVAMAQVNCSFFWPWENHGETYRSFLGQFWREGDHLNLLAVYEAWKVQGFSRIWCEANLVNAQSFKIANDLRDRLQQIIKGHNLLKNNIVDIDGPKVTNIAKAVTSGLFFHAARKNRQVGGYRTLVGNSLVYIHPHSVLYRQQPNWVIYNKLGVMADEKEYMFGVMGIDPNWLIELAPRFFNAKTE